MKWKKFFIEISIAFTFGLSWELYEHWYYSIPVGVLGYRLLNWRIALEKETEDDRSQNSVTAWGT